MGTMKEYSLLAGRLIFALISIGLCHLVRAQGQAITFSATGDVPYSSSEATIFQQQVANHNKYSPSAFLVHVGDIKAESGTCSESNYSSVANIMKGLAVPVWIVAGDNETVDCSSPTLAMSYFLKYFQNFEQNFCGAPLAENQSVRPDNWAFTLDGVLFIGINSAYGGSTGQQQAADWVKQQLEAKASEVRAAAVFSHYSPSKSTTFSTPFRQAAAAFGNPILFLHGHGHSWSMDYPFPELNILRVQVNNGGAEDPVEVMVTMNTSSPATAFTFKQNPWTSKIVYNMPPCVNAGPDQMITGPAVANLQGAAKDDGDPNGSLTVTWSQVSGPSAVSFENVNALATTVSFGATGTYILSLTANDGALQRSDEVTIAVNTTITPGPMISSFTPASGMEGTEVTISGTNFTGITDVAFNGIAAASFTVNSETEILASVPAGATTGKISVTNADGTGYSATNFVVTAPPTIVSFTPTLGPEGVEVTILGSNFTGATSVSFNGNTATSLLVDSDSQIRAKVPAGSAPGTGKIVVTNSAGSATSAEDFTITAAPIVLSFSPKHDAYIKSSSPASNYGSAGTVRGKLGSSEINHSYLKFEVTGLSGTVQSAKLRLNVSDASTDGGAIYLVSNNYKSSSTPWIESGLNWNNAPGISGTALSAIGAVSVGQWVEFDVTPAIVGNGIYNFGLKNSVSDVVYYRSKEGGASTAPQLVIQSLSSGAPSLTSFAPADGPVGTEVAITGNNFSSASEVTFNGVPAIFAVESNTQIRATVPEGATIGKIVITNPHGNGSYAQDFVVTATPVITSFTPTSAIAGAEVTITGDHFNGTTSVSLNGNAAATFYVDSDNQIRVIIPVGATPGTGKIVVTNSAGSAESSDEFTINLLFIFAPTHDAYVKSSSATSNYGTASSLRGKLSSSEINHSYLKFEVTGLSGTLLSAKLRLYVTDASPDGGAVYLASNNYKSSATPWVEKGLNWNNAPGIAGTPLSSVGKVSKSQWVEFDVTSAIAGDGTYCFGLKNNVSDVVYYSSKEASGTKNDPQLVILLSGAAAASKRAGLTPNPLSPENENVTTIIPNDFVLEQNYPNPFNPSTQIQFGLPQASHVTIKVYAITGAEVETLVDGQYPAGTHAITFRAKSLSSGTYFYVMQAGEVRQVRRLMLVK
jgi:hypothetical protein